MERKLNVKRLWWLSISFFIIVADQVTKIQALHYLTDKPRLIVLPLLNFTLAFNQGAAFSFLSQAGGWQNLFFIVFAVAVVACLVIYLLKNPSCTQCFGLSLIIAGALGNIVDRLHYGFVIDFIDVHVGSYHWPVFNLADSAITVGVMILLVSYFVINTKCGEKNEQR